MNIENLDKAKLAEACETALNSLRLLYGKLELETNSLGFEDDGLAEDLLNRPELWPLSLLRVALGRGDELDEQMAVENWKDGHYIGEDVDAEDYEDDDLFEDDDEGDVFEVELGDGSCMEFDDSDGTIRYRDEHGNCEQIWRVGDKDYDAKKEEYFADVEINMMNESDDRPNHCPRCERWVSDEDFVSYQDKCEMCCLDVD